MDHFTAASAASPGFSVVIPTYRRHQQLCECLDCLALYFDVDARRPQGPSIEVIVSDDAHEEELRLLLQQLYPWCRYVQGPRRGPAANRNHGASQASGAWLVFTDDDCLPQPGWIEAYDQLADQCDVMEGQTNASDRRTRLDQECPINETGGYLWSCNFAIRRELFLQLGGFNENFPAAAMEDVELNRRIVKAGLRRLFLPSAQVKHPWRSRKGRSFVRAKARSIATYVSLHPETAPSFSSTVQILNVLRSLKSTFTTAVAIATVQGLSRQIALDIYAAVATWKAVGRR